MSSDVKPPVIVEAIQHIEDRKYGDAVKLLTQHLGTDTNGEVNALLALAHRHLEEYGPAVEHYEIASYGTLCNMAKILGKKDAAKLLHEILDQEKSTDTKLSSLCDDIELEAMEKAA